MKCEYCGSPLSLETEYCPHCGRANQHGQQHARDMHYYQKDYQQVREDVYNATKLYSQISIRMIIAATLIVLSGVFWLLGEYYRDIVRDIQIKQNEKNLAENTVILDQLIEEADFLQYDIFYDREYMEYAQGYGGYYYQIYKMCNYYCAIYNNILPFVEGVKYDVAEYEQELENLADWIERFYEEKEKEYRVNGMSEVEKGKYLLVEQEMENQIHGLLRVYCNCTEEDVASLSELTALGIESLLTERISE